jgi:drug/metabolite transporter superfamily protein YnfA
MIYLAIILFTLAALLGLTILVKWLTKKAASRAVVYSHGIAAAAGLLLLVIFAVRNPANFPRISLALFLVAAIAGFYMFSLDLKKKAHPMIIAFAHALVAVCGFVLLLLFAIS